jgi:MFS family permease
LARNSSKRIPKFYYGWWVVLSTAIVYGFMGGLNYSGFSVYFLPLTREFSISRTRVSIIFSLRSLLDIFTGPFGGILVDKFGPRFMVMAGMLIGGIGFILLATTKSYFQLIFVLMAFISLGFSMPDHGVTAGINTWFRRRLGFAISLASSGFGIGGFLLTPIIAWLVLQYSWRSAAVTSGIIILIIGIPISFIFRNPKHGESDSEDFKKSPEIHESISSNLQTLDFSLKESLHTWTFWLLGISLGLRLLAQHTLMVHIVPILVGIKLTEGIAATLIALVALSRVPTSLIAGFIADRWSRQKICGVANLFGALACVILLISPKGLGSGIVFAIFFGSAHASNAITWALIGQFFGRQHFGTIRGVISLVPSITTALGPVLAGWSYDRNGSYHTSLIVLGIIYIGAAVIFWFLKQPTNPKHST